MTPLHRALLCLLLVVVATTHPAALASASDWYCGANWMAASASCSLPCSIDPDCPPGEDCHGFTGCAAGADAAAPPIPPPAEPSDPAPPPTPKPRRTKRPTPVPAGKPPSSGGEQTGRPTDAPPAESHAGPPTASPIVRPQLVGINTVTRDGTILSKESQRSYGVIFDVQTTANSPAISIRSLEFYAPTLGANVAYEVWTKPDTWHGYEGMVRRYALLASGNVTTSAVEGGYTRLPAGSFEIKLDGGGARHAIYLTLSSRELVYAHSTSGGEAPSVDSISDVTKPTTDTIVLVETPELIVYEGAAVMAHPFEKARRSIHYRMPRGFVGKVWYHRAPCDEYPVTVTNETDGSTREEWRTVQRWEECAYPKPRASLPLGVGRLPSFDVDGGEGGGGNATRFNGTAPTLSPTASSPPTIHMMKANLVLTLRNVAEDRLLNNEEQRAFEQTTIDFYERREVLDANEVELHGATVRYQKLVGIDDERGRGRRYSGRQLQDEMVGPVQQIATNGDDPAVEEPSATSLEVTLVVAVLYSPLPLPITQELLRTLIVTDEVEYVESLRATPALSSLLGTVDGLPSVLVVDRLTDPPTRRPTGAPTSRASKIEEAGPGGGTVFAVVFLLFWFAMTICSISYINRARRKMREDIQKRKVMEEGGEQSATAFVGHGMVYEEEAKETAPAEKGGLRSSLVRMATKRNLFAKGSMSSSRSLSRNRNGSTGGRRNLFAGGSMSSSSADDPEQALVQREDRHFEIDDDPDDSGDSGEEEESLEESYSEESESE